MYILSEINQTEWNSTVVRDYFQRWINSLLCVQHSKIGRLYQANHVSRISSCWFWSVDVISGVKTHQFPKTERYKCFRPAPAPCARLSSHSWRSSWTWVDAHLPGAPGWPSAGAFSRRWGRCQGGLETSWCPGTCADLLYTAEGSDGGKSRISNTLFKDLRARIH